MSWISAAFLAALFAGVRRSLRSAVCVIRILMLQRVSGRQSCSFLLGSWSLLRGQPVKSLVSVCFRGGFLLASGAATGASWICYFKALSVGDVNKVVPVDKSSTILAALLAIVLFGETSNLAIKLVSIAVIGVGTYLMIERRVGESRADAETSNHGWLWYAMGAAVFAALTSILAKYGIEGVDSNLATAIRTCVVLVMAWGIVAARGKLNSVSAVRVREALFLVASGIATGASWLFFYYAIQTGQVSIVVQIDKLSIVVSIAFAWLFLHERLTPRSGVGLVLIVFGTAFMTAFP